MVSEKPISRPTQFSGWLERRNVPRPRARANIPSSTSGEMALRMVMRLTPKCRPSSASVIKRPVSSISAPSLTWRRMVSRTWICSGTEPAGADGAASFASSVFLRVRVGMSLQALSCHGIEQMNVLRTGGDRNRVALPWNVRITDADADQRAGAIEIEYGHVAEVFDEFDPGLQALRRDPQRAGTNARHHLELARGPHRRLEPVVRNDDIAIDV